jgi:energy-coupling factor transporter ATP-binding protein EcfA2
MPESHDTRKTSLHIDTLTFADGKQLTLAPNDVVLILGPNNAGKSATLRAIRNKLHDSRSNSPIVTSLTIRRDGTSENFLKWIEGWTAKSDSKAPEPELVAHGISLNRSYIKSCWERNDNSIGDVARWLCQLLTAGERLRICDPPQNTSLSSGGPTHPIHFLQRDDTLELQLSTQFRKAFGADLVVHRNAGSIVPLHIGSRPTPQEGEDRVSLSYILKVEALPQLDGQGDGMRSFAGVLLASSVGRESIFLIDEPEAFLHPPQAKLLGTLLVEQRGKSRQLFIATHSSDILQGVLDTNIPDVKILRIRRNGDNNTINILNNQSVRELWSDPLLRYSNIFDALFHEAVVVCEADSDCRFYSAMLKAALTTRSSDSKQPDLMFTHCGGKARLPLVVRALRELDVPVHVVADFDVLSDEYILKSIVEGLGADWSTFSVDWKIVKSAIDGKRPELDAAQVRSELLKVLDAVVTTELPEKSRLELQSVIRRSNAWSIAKVGGKAFVPSGDPSKACDRLLTGLRRIGLHVVEVGELEGFARTVGGHGPKWVNEVLSKDLVNDPELSQARHFSLSLIEEPVLSN